VKTCTRLSQEGMKRDDAGNITRLGEVLDVSFVDDSHVFGIRDGEWHLPSSVSVGHLQWRKE